MKWSIFFISGPFDLEMILHLKLATFDYDPSLLRYMAKPKKALGYPAGPVTPCPPGGRLVIFDENGRKGLHPQQLQDGGRYRIKSLDTPTKNYEWAYLSNYNRKSILILITTIIKYLGCISIFYEIHLCKQVTSITTYFALIMNHKYGYCIHKSYADWTFQTFVSKTFIIQIIT